MKKFILPITVLAILFIGSCSDTQTDKSSENDAGRDAYSNQPDSGMVDTTVHDTAHQH